MAAKSHEVAEQLKEAVVDQANQVRDRAQSAKQHTVDRIRGVATQIRGMGDTLREDDPFVSKFAARASDSIEGVANYVGSASTQSFIRDTEQLARRQPLLFFGGAFLAGLAAGRFLKSSRPESDSGPSTTRSSDYYGSASASRLQERPSNFLPPRNAVPMPSTGSSTSNYDAAFGRDLPDSEGRAAGAMRNASTGSMAGNPTGSKPMGSTPLPGVSDPTPNTPLPSTPSPSAPPPRRRDKNGGGTGQGTLP